MESFRNESLVPTGPVSPSRINKIDPKLKCALQDLLPAHSQRAGSRGDDEEIMEDWLRGTGVGNSAKPEQSTRAPGLSGRAAVELQLSRKSLDLLGLLGRIR